MKQRSFFFLSFFKSIQQMDIFFVFFNQKTTYCLYLQPRKLLLELPYKGSNYLHCLFFSLGFIVFTSMEIIRLVFVDAIAIGKSSHSREYFVASIQFCWKRKSFIFCYFFNFWPHLISHECVVFTTILLVNNNVEMGLRIPSANVF